MNAYIYQGSLFCDACGPDIQEVCTPSADSDSYPQGPFPDGGGIKDRPQHCHLCGCFLENPLTEAGETWLTRELLDKPAVAWSERMQGWAFFYRNLPEVSKVLSQITAEG